MSDVELQLAANFIVLVDEEDVERILLFGPWHKEVDRVGNTYGRSQNKKWFLHRLIFNDPTAPKVDHINRNTLDNTKRNLRKATHRQNCVNRIVPQSVNGSGYRGVKKQVNKNYTSYFARITTEEGRIELGTFRVAEEAARAYDAAALKYHGEFAVLNFPICEIDPQILSNLSE